MKTKLILTSLFTLLSTAVVPASFASQQQSSENVVSKYQFTLKDDIYPTNTTYYTIIPNYRDDANSLSAASTQTVTCNGQNVGPGLNINVPAGTQLTCKVVNKSSSSFAHFPALKIRWVMKNVPYISYENGTYTSSLTFIDLPFPPLNNNTNLGSLSMDACGGLKSNGNIKMSYGSCTFYPGN